MDYQKSDGGRVDLRPSGDGRVDFHWTFDAVQERFVEAMQFWWRVEGGSWPFAGDGPWHLIERDWADLNTDVAEGRPIAPVLKPVPMSLDEIARRDQATEWFLLIQERDRQLVQIAVAYLARGAAQVPWTKVRRKMRVENGTRALGMRYSRAITSVAQQLTRARVPVELA